MANHRIRKKRCKERHSYINLQNRYEEMYDYLHELIDDNHRNESEIRYLKDFIHYKNLEEEYQYFYDNAHEETEEDLPFSYYTI